MTYTPITARNAASTRGDLSTSAGGAWTPASLPGLVVWYDTSNAGSITASAGNVSQWNTLGGSTSGAHLTQATGGNQPKTGVFTINSKNTITCDGTNDWMAVTFTTIPQPVTILMVLQMPASTPTGTWHDSNDTGNRVQSFMSGGYALYAGSVVATGFSVSNNEKFQIVSVFNGASTVGYKNGTAGSTVNPGAQQLHGLTIGSDSGRAGPYNGHYGEIAVMAGAASVGDRASWASYCTTKWAT